MTPDAKSRYRYDHTRGRVRSSRSSRPAVEGALFGILHRRLPRTIVNIVVAALVCPAAGGAQSSGNDPDRPAERDNTVRSEPSLAEAARLLDDNQLDAAVSLLEERIAAGDDSAHARLLLGRAYYGSLRWADALAEFEASIRLNPDDELARLDIAQIYLAAGLPDQADSALADSLLSSAGSGNPRYQDLYFALAESFADAGRIGNAKRSMAQAASFDGPVEKAVIFKRLGDFATQLVQFDAALEAYRNALEIDPGHTPSRIALASLYLRDNRPEDALTELTHVLEGDPDDVTALMGVAETQLATENLSEAARAAGRARDLAPDNRRARYVLGRSLFRMGRTEEGRKELEEYRKLEAEFQASDHRAREIHAVQSAAMVHLLEGRNDAAVTLLENAIGERPRSTELRLSLGLVLSQSERHQAAVEAFSGLLELPVADAAVVHRHLEREYRLLGDVRSSLRHGELADALDATRGEGGRGGAR